jgi:hypothetical protein
MIERRQSARARVMYGGVIAYDKRQSTTNCVIRNFSEDGAKVEFRQYRAVAGCNRPADCNEESRVSGKDHLAPGQRSRIGLPSGRTRCSNSARLGTPIAGVRSRAARIAEPDHPAVVRALIATAGDTINNPIISRVPRRRSRRDRNRIHHHRSGRRIGDGGPALPCPRHDHRKVRTGCLGAQASE